MDGLELTDLWGCDRQAVIRYGFLDDSLQSDMSGTDAPSLVSATGFGQRARILADGLRGIQYDEAISGRV